MAEPFILHGPRPLYSKHSATPLSHFQRKMVVELLLILVINIS